MASQTMSSNTSENRISSQMCNGCGDQMELLTSRTRKNPNRKFWICRGCNNFEWAEDCKPSEGKIDLLVDEVRKLALEIECLSVKFELLQHELRKREAPRYDCIKLIMIVVLCFLFKYCF